MTSTKSTPVAPSHWVRRSQRPRKDVDYSNDEVESHNLKSHHIEWGDSGEEEAPEYDSSEEVERGARQSLKRKKKTSSTGRNRAKIFKTSTLNKKRRLDVEKENEGTVFVKAPPREPFAMREALKNIRNRNGSVGDKAVKSIAQNKRLETLRKEPECFTDPLPSSCDAPFKPIKPMLSLAAESRQRTPVPSLTPASPLHQYTHLYSSPGQAYPTKLPATVDGPQSPVFPLVNHAFPIVCSYAVHEEPFGINASDPYDLRSLLQQTDEISVATANAPNDPPLTNVLYCNKSLQTSFVTVRKVRPATLLDIAEMADIANCYNQSVLNALPIMDSEMRGLYMETTEKFNLPFVVFVQNEGVAGRTPMILGYAHAEYFCAHWNVMIHIIVREGLANSLVSLFLMYALLEDLKKIGREEAQHSSEWGFVEIQGHNVVMQSQAEGSEEAVLYLAELAKLRLVHSLD
ncbi:hypothetical protein BDQ17DRAFT_1364263 [Cyathus striatus]|nr:hypothetical protein BDQ17DRAFT_1364263 [Cyathus striatus]